MKIYLGASKLDHLAKCKENGYGLCISASHWRNYKEEFGLDWFFDNGAWNAYNQGMAFDAATFRKCLKKIESCPKKPDFIVCPDMVRGGNKSLEFSLRWVDDGSLPLDIPIYLAVQDGIEVYRVIDCIEKFDGIFIGGSNEWKWGKVDIWDDFGYIDSFEGEPDMHWTRVEMYKSIADDYGLPIHVGCVGSRHNLMMAKDIKVNSVDTTTIIQANGQGMYGKNKGFQRLQNVAAQTTFSDIHFSKGAVSM